MAIELDLEIGEGKEPEPVATLGATRRPSKRAVYDAMVKAADEAASDPAQLVVEEQIGGKPVKVGPWRHWPTDETPQVHQTEVSRQRNRWGKKSRYPSDNKGAYFEFRLSNPVDRRGVLYVRKVIPVVVEEDS